MEARPFIKWVGGKSQLLSEIRQKYPEELGKSITKYCEPFVGGGAVFFDVMGKYAIEEILINDINKELINAYFQIKHGLDGLLLQLEKMQERFWLLENEERDEYYYEKRARFNLLKMSGAESDIVEKAALFIFINKTCFNGLFRVNKKGIFNVPVGSYKKPLICDASNLIAINKLLKNVTIKCGDYKKCSEAIDEKTFVYIDPPYRPLTATARFTSYTESDFSDKEQRELGGFVDNITAKNAKVILSNSDPKNSDEEDNFFDDLYGGYKILRVNAKRMINCNAEKRGNVRELLISNY